MSFESKFFASVFSRLCPTTVSVDVAFLASAIAIYSVSSDSVFYSMATIARKRPVHYSTVLSALLDFENIKIFHAPSILFSLRSAFLGFLRCTNPAIIEVKLQIML